MCVSVLGLKVWHPQETVPKVVEPSVADVSTLTPEIVSQPTKPLSLEDIQVTFVRVGTDVTMLLDWKPNTTPIPFHLWVEVDGSDVILRSPGSVPRGIEVVPNETLVLYGSTLYHELTNNRLAIDLQVETQGEPK